MDESWWLRKKSIDYILADRLAQHALKTVHKRFLERRIQIFERSNSWAHLLTHYYDFSFALFVFLCTMHYYILLKTLLSILSSFHCITTHTHTYRYIWLVAI